jgi:hypothetical protein
LRRRAAALWRTRIDRIAEIAYARAMSFAEDT